MLKRILCVDDEPNVLQGFERQFRKQYEVHTALGPEPGLRALSEAGPFAVVVSDLRMPNMNGVDFLAEVKKLAPNTVRIMLTGQADLDTAIAAVNQGHVFQFLTKPCPSEMLARTLDAALEQYRLVVSERELLEQTLRGSIGVLSEILSLANPLAFSRAQRVRHYVRQLAAKLELADQWQYELAAMLSQIGCIAIPPEILEKFHLGEPLNPDEADTLASQGQIGHNLLAQIPRLDEVAQMIARQRESWKGQTDNRDKVKVGANLLKVAQDFDDAMLHGGEVETVLTSMRYRSVYNHAFLDALQQVHVGQTETEVRFLAVSQLRTRMVINADVLSKHGLLLLAKGQEVTASALLRLNSFAGTVGVKEPISVIVPYSLQSAFDEKRIPAPEGALP